MEFISTQEKFNY